MEAIGDQFVILSPKDVFPFIDVAHCTNLLTEAQISLVPRTQTERRTIGSEKSNTNRNHALACPDVGS